MQEKKRKKSQKKFRKNDVTKNKEKVNERRKTES